MQRSPSFERLLIAYANPSLHGMSVLYKYNYSLCYIQGIIFLRWTKTAHVCANRKHTHMLICPNGVNLVDDIKIINFIYHCCQRLLRKATEVPDQLFLQRPPAFPPGNVLQSIVYKHMYHIKPYVGHINSILDLNDCHIEFAISNNTS